jgi:hypothetical protein
MHIPLISPLLKLVTTLINSLSSRAIRRAEACRDFRETFNRALQGLYPMPSNWPKGTGIEPRLRAVFPALQAAVATFRPYVPEKEQARFDEAWLNYHTSTKRAIDQDYTHYMNMTSTTSNSFGGETVIPADGKAQFRRNVDRLLAFARDV